MSDTEKKPTRGPLSFVADNARRVASSTPGLNRFVASTYKPPAREQVKQGERGEAWWRDFAWEEYATQYLPGLGLAFSVYPYVAVWEKIWGAIPTEDYVKYKRYYTQEPFIRATIDLHTMMAFSQGYEIDYPIDEVVEDVKEFLERHDFLNGLKILGKDVLTFGNAYIEVVRLWICPHTGHDLTKLRVSFEEQNKEGKGWWWTDRMDVVYRHNEMYPEHELENPYGEIVRLKYLDPSYMRVRRDAYGTALGYVQWYMFPLVTLLADEVVHLRYMPSSWTYESVYGVSMLRPILFHQELVKQYEQTMGQIMQVYLKPMFVVKVGNPNSPTGETRLDQYNQIVQAFARRKPGTDVIVRTGGLIADVQPIQAPIQSLQGSAFWLQWLHNMRTYALTVPKFFTDPAGLNRATAQIVQESYFTFITGIRQMLSAQIEQEIMPKILRSLYGPMADTLITEYGLPKLIWKPVKEESAASKTPMVLDWFKSGLIDINEARTMLGLKPLEENELLERQQKAKSPELQTRTLEQTGQVPISQPEESLEEAEMFQELIQKELSNAPVEASDVQPSDMQISEGGKTEEELETKISDVEEWVEDMRNRLRQRKREQGNIDF